MPDENVIFQKNGDTDKQVEKLTDKSNKVLFKISTVFPFKFFTDDIIIDPLKVNIVEREFFGTETIRSIPFDQIIETQILSGVLFSTIKILSKGLKSEEVDVTYLKKSDAKKAKKIIDGLVLCKNNNIDPIELEDDTLTSKMEEIGETPNIKS